MVAATDGPSRPGLPDTPAAGAIVGRLFVVGCARSGTTLLQSLLAAHPAVVSFPETWVLGRLFSPDAMPGEARLGTVHRRTQLAYRHARLLLDSLGRRDLEQLLPMRSKSTGQFVDGFVTVLDRLALDRGKSWWVEKTPENIDFVPEILEHVPGAKIINILRDGRQNVAALYDMARKYADSWWGGYRDLDRAIGHWNKCVGHTRRSLEFGGVLLVRYERLVAATEAVMEEVCRFAGLPFSREMIERRAEAASAVVTAREPWKADVLAPMRSVAADRFNEVFDAEQKLYVETRLDRVDF